MNEVIERAAVARAEAMRAQGDRPRERRSSETPSSLTASRAVVRRPVQVRAADGGGNGLHFTGYASVTETPYEMYDMFGPYSEVVSADAFNKSLSLGADLDVPLVLGHDSMRRIARTTNGSLSLSVDDTGLLCDAPDLDPTDADVAYIAPKLLSGLIDEMSFRFSIDAGQWSPDYTEFRINDANIQRGDVSIVGYGANPATSGSLREAMEALERAGARDLDQIVASLTDEDFSQLQRAIAVQRRQRGIRPPMTLHDLLAIGD